MQADWEPFGQRPGASPKQAFPKIELSVFKVPISLVDPSVNREVVA